MVIDLEDGAKSDGDSPPDKDIAGDEGQDEHKTDADILGMVQFYAICTLSQRFFQWK